MNDSATLWGFNQQVPYLQLNPINDGSDVKSEQVNAMYDYHVEQYGESSPLIINSLIRLK